LYARLSAFDASRYEPSRTFPAQDLFASAPSAPRSIGGVVEGGKPGAARLAAFHHTTYRASSGAASCGGKNCLKTIGEDS